MHRRARLHLLVTGSELLPLGAPPEPGKIHESNGLMVRLLAERAGAQVIDGGVIADDFESTRAAVEAGLGGDVLVVSGGVSRRPARPRQARVRGVRRRGGVLARARQARQAAVVRPPRRRRSCSACPGNPLSSIVGFLAFIEPALRRMHGERDAVDADRAGAADRGRRPVRRPHHVPHLAPRPRRRRRARGDADRQPGLAPDRRARPERRLRRSPPTAPARWPPGRPSTPSGLSSWRESDFRERGAARTRGAGSAAAIDVWTFVTLLLLLNEQRRDSVRCDQDCYGDLPDLRGRPPVDELHGLVAVGRPEHPDDDRVPRRRSPALCSCSRTPAPRGHPHDRRRS